MPDSTDIITTIDILADLSADVTAVRGWLARLHSGYDIGPRERAAIARHLTRLRDNAAAVVYGATLLGLVEADDSQEAAGES